MFSKLCKQVQNLKTKNSESRVETPAKTKTYDCSP